MLIVGLPKTLKKQFDSFSALPSVVGEISYERFSVGYIDQYGDFYSVNKSLTLRSYDSEYIVCSAIRIKEYPMLQICGPRFYSIRGY